MRAKSLIWIIVLFILVLPTVSAKGFSEYPRLFHDTFDLSNNLSLTGCTVGSGKLTCNDASQAIYIHKLPNQTTNSVNWSITLVGIEFQQLDTDYAFRTVEENSTSATLAWAIGVTGATDALLGVDPADTRVDVFLVTAKPFNFTFLHMPNGTIFMYVNQSNETMEANASGTNALDNEGIFMYWGSTAVSGYQYTIEEFIVRNHTLAQADSTPPGITFYNMTSQGGEGCTDWNTDKNIPCTTSDTTPTVVVRTNESASCRIGIADKNYTDMGASRECAGGATEFTCTLTAQDELTEQNSFIYIGCRDNSAKRNENPTSTSGALRLTVNPVDLERYARVSIENGIRAALTSGYTIYTDQKIYARNSANQQSVGTFDKVVKWMSRIWAFNFLVGNDTRVGMFNVTPVLYVLEMNNVTNTTINTSVYNFIQNTK